MRACDRIYRDLQVKCRGPEAGPALCASLHKVESRSTFHKSHFTRKFTGKMSRPRSGTRTLCEPARPKFMSTFHKRLYTEIDRKNAAAQIEPRTQTHTLCEPAQSKCRGQHFTKATLYGNLQYRKNAVVRLEHPDQAPAFTPTVRSPQCQHTAWGKIMSHSYPQLRVYLEKKQPCPSLPAAKYLLGRPMRYLFMLRLDIALVRCSVWTRVASSNQVWVKPHPVLMQQKVKLSQTKVQHQQLHRGTYFCLHIATDAFFCTCKNTLHENKR